MKLLTITTSIQLLANQFLSQIHLYVANIAEYAPLFHWLSGSVRLDAVQWTTEICSAAWHNYVFTWYACPHKEGQVGQAELPTVFPTWHYSETNNTTRC